MYTVYSLYLKLKESVTFPNVKENVWNNIEILLGYVLTNKQILKFIWQLIWKFPKFIFFPNYANY